MAKAQFNCRLESEIAEWIASEALRLTASKGTKYSQADIIARLVIRCGMPASKREIEASKFPPGYYPPPQPDPKPRKLSKKAQAAAALASSDLTAQGVGRDDIEYGSHTELPQGQHVATLDAVGPSVSGGKGKATSESWRRAPRQKGDKSR